MQQGQAAAVREQVAVQVCKVCNEKMSLSLSSIFLTVAFNNLISAS